MADVKSKLEDISRLLAERRANQAKRSLDEMMRVKDICDRGLWCIACRQPFDFFCFGDGAQIMPIFQYGVCCGCPVKFPPVPRYCWT